MASGFRDLIVYQKAFDLAMEIFKLRKNFHLKKSMSSLTKSGELHDPFAER
ncbi:MAG: four helix bundle protein [Lentimicrobium sp.]